MRFHLSKIQTVKIAVSTLISIKYNFSKHIKYNIFYLLANGLKITNSFEYRKIALSQRVLYFLFELK